jgi:hypothetical protein
MPLLIKKSSESTFTLKMIYATLFLNVGNLQECTLLIPESGRFYTFRREKR